MATSGEAPIRVGLYTAQPGHAAGDGHKGLRIAVRPPKHVELGLLFLGGHVQGAAP